MFTCTVCNKTYQREGNYRNHRIQVHPTPEDIEEQNRKHLEERKSTYQNDKIWQRSDIEDLNTNGEWSKRYWIFNCLPSDFSICHNESDAIDLRRVDSFYEDRQDVINYLENQLEIQKEGNYSFNMPFIFDAEERRFHVFTDYIDDNESE